MTHERQRNDRSRKQRQGKACEVTSAGDGRGALAVARPVMMVMVVMCRMILISLRCCVGQKGRRELRRAQHQPALCSGHGARRNQHTQSQGRKKRGSKHA